MKMKTLALATSLFTAMSTAALAELSVTSPDLTTGEPITDAQYWNNFGCTGENARPEINWQNAPEGTKSFAVTFYDQDAPTGSGFWHWVIFDIASDITGISPEEIPAGAIEGNTDLGQPGFFGPCPPLGREHTYIYTVHALDIEKLDAPTGATAPLTGFFINMHSIEQATLSVQAGPRSE